MQTHAFETVETVRPFARETARVVSQDEQNTLGLTPGLVNGHTVLTTPYPEWP